METLGRSTLVAMVPVHLLLVAWVWGGRLVFGVGGWMLLVYLAGVVPLLLLALLTSTVLAFTQPAEPGAPRALTRAQARAQLSTWGAMAALGLFTVDFGDTEDSTRSVLTQVLGTGEAVLGVSVALWVGAVVATVVAWVVLVVTLTAGRRRLAA